MARAWRKWIIPVVVVLGVLALVVPSVLPGIIGTPQPADSSSALPTEDMGESQQRSILEVGSTAPGFSLQDTEGETISLESLEGKPVLIAFFAPWCPHCQDEVPRLNQIHAQYGDRVHIVSISATPYGKDYPADRSSITLDDLTWFQEEFSITYPLLFDPDVGVGTAYKIGSFPTTYFLDAQHRVVEVFEGGRPVAEFQSVLNGILGNQ
ncbi:MAG: TlpA disulfide reductase family protein [Chloroflexi bacterium]|nr:TlpA disulfide reductase family protein [Chloroflexota bacterium]